MAPRTSAQVVVARTEEGNKELLERLVDLGIDAMEIETIAFQDPSDWTEVDRAIWSIGDYDWVVFTSPRAVRAYLLRTHHFGHRIRRPSPRFAAVGPKTASILEQAGLVVDFVPQKFLTAALARGLPSEFGKRVVLFRADIATKELPDVLVRRGFEVTDLAIYSTRMVPGAVNPRRLSGARLVVFASPSEVRGFKSKVPPKIFVQLTQRALALCIGPVTADEARVAGFRKVASPSEHTLDALVRKVREAVSIA
jgi:uroporphyrinogen III methyltransferase / synthase